MRLPRMRLLAAAAGAVAVIGACGDAESAVLEDQSILDTPIAGTTRGRTTVDDAAATVTRLYEVAGDWNAVSVAIADAVIDTGWTIEAVNCVGTGNDVIARKRVEGRWLLLESGAGTRGAGIILSFAADDRGPSPLAVTGRCPRDLIDATGA